MTLGDLIETAGGLNQLLTTAQGFIGLINEIIAMFPGKDPTLEITSEMVLAEKAKLNPPPQKTDESE